MRSFEYEQQLAHLKMPLEDIKTMLNNKGVLYAGIIHDKDKTEPHVHFMVKLNSDMTVENVAKWFQDEQQYINIKKSRWGNKLSYLVHRTENSKDKFQYNPNEVFANFDYISELEKITTQIENTQKIDDIIELIQEGIIREHNLPDYVDAHMFAKHKPLIINALEWYRRKVMTNKDRNITVMLFSGDTGTGKTTFAKNYCKNANKSFCVSSSSNDPMQDYKGEDVLILDDLRDSTFKYADLLKILDNHTNSTVASRYNNKAFIGDTIIITSTEGIRNWYESKTEEDIKQLWRRIPQWFVFTKEFIKVWTYDEDKKDYVFVSEQPNFLHMQVRKVRSAIIDTMEKMGFNLTEDDKNKMLNAPYGDNTVGEVMNKNDDDLPF